MPYHLQCYEFLSTNIVSAMINSLVPGVHKGYAYLYKPAADSVSLQLKHHKMIMNQQNGEGGIARKSRINVWK